MADISLDVSAFRLQFPEFASTAQYSDSSLAGYWAAATSYIAPTSFGVLSGDRRARAINLMMAHLVALAAMIQAGDTPGVVSSAGVDKETVSLTPPPLKTQWQWWLSTTPHGAQLWALIQTVAVGGFYVGGRPERSAFRRAGGF